MVLISIRLPAGMVAAVDAAAVERHATRSALIRGVLEDALDSGELPDVPSSPESVREQLAELRDRELEQLRQLTG